MRNISTSKAQQDPNVGNSHITVGCTFFRSVVGKFYDKSRKFEPMENSHVAKLPELVGVEGNLGHFWSSFY